MNAETQEKFSVADMLAAASAETCLDDFGDDEFREALTQLVNSTNNDGGLTTLSELGAMAFKGEIHRTLVNRLRFARDLKLHPEILDEDVEDPIIILGMPRTGTSKLQRFMSADPDVQRLDYWRLFNPAPFPNAVPGKEDPRIDAARQAIAMMAQLMPKWMDSHPTAAEEVDEDVFLQMYTFKAMVLYMFRPVPSYQTWMATQSLAGTYHYMKQMLQYLQWQMGGKKGPWIMKTPVHLSTMDLLVELFPKATLVCTHRNLHNVIPSHCRLMESTRQLYTGKVDMNEIGRACVGDFAWEIEKHLRQRDAMGDRLQILDIQYEQTRDDPIGVIRQVYERAGRKLTQHRIDAMLAWEKVHPLHHAGSYTYRMEDYGLTPESIDAAFREYNERFIR